MDESDHITDYTGLYNKFFQLAVRSCSDYTGTAVASTMIGIAMRLYKTSMTEEDFERIMSHILTTTDEVRSYTASDFQGSQTLH